MQLEECSKLRKRLLRGCRTKRETTSTHWIGKRNSRNGKRQTRIRKRKTQIRNKKLESSIHTYLNRETAIHQPEMTIPTLYPNQEISICESRNRQKKTNNPTAKRHLQVRKTGQQCRDPYWFSVGRQCTTPIPIPKPFWPERYTKPSFENTQAIL